MIDAGVGRLLVASLHQGIADLLPGRLEFYEAWLNPAGLREGKIGLAPLAAVLSFLRLEGDPYSLVAARAGEYTAEWTFAELPPIKRSMIRAAPTWLRMRLVMRVATGMVRNTYGGSRAVVRWRKGKGAVNVRGSVFCEVRDPVEKPLCQFYEAAISTMMQLFGLSVEVGTQQCRATGAGQCLITVMVRRAGATG